jgi:hypothetical protein
MAGSNPHGGLPCCLSPTSSKKHHDAAAAFCCCHVSRGEQQRHVIWPAGSTSRKVSTLTCCHRPFSLDVHSIQKLHWLCIYLRCSPNINLVVQLKRTIQFQSLCMWQWMFSAGRDDVTPARGYHEVTPTKPRSLPEASTSAHDIHLSVVWANC